MSNFVERRRITMQLLPPPLTPLRILCAPDAGDNGGSPPLFLLTDDALPMSSTMSPNQMPTSVIANGHAPLGEEADADNETAAATTAVER